MPDANANAALPAFDRREVGLERQARRVLRARVLEALVLAERVLHVGRGLIDRRDDRAGRGVGLLAGVQADRGESRVRVELHDPIISRSSYYGRVHADACRASHRSTRCLSHASPGTRRGRARRPAGGRAMLVARGQGSSCCSLRLSARPAR